jgi:hydroxyacylglutathione hydrolase
MKPDRKKQNQQARRRSRAKVISGSIFAVAAIVFALGLIVSPSSSGETKAVESFRRIDVGELTPLVARGEVTIIDVRDADAYLAGHIPGSLQIPLSRIEGEIPYLPKGKRIVTYCTCPAEESSGLAVQILEHGGITDAAALRGGLDAWRKSGAPVESGYPRR